MKIIIGPAAEGEFYFDRPYLAERFEKKLRESHNLSIAAPRRVGKSSFMLHLVAQPAKGYIYKYIIPESVNDSNEFFKTVYKTLLGLLNTGGKFKQFFEGVFKRLEVKKISLSEIEFGKNEIDYFQEILLLCKEVKETDARIVLMIDEYSQTIENIITDQSREAAKNFLHQCRELRQNLEVKSKISFVYTGSIGLENLVLSIDEPKSITDIGNFSIPPLSVKEAKELVTKIIDGDPIRFEETDLDYFVNKMNWLLPYFIQLMMSEIDTICKEKAEQRITQLTIDEAFKRALDNRSYFEHWLVRLRTIFKGSDFSCAKEILKIAAVNNGINYYELQNTVTKFKIEDGAPLINILQHDGYLVKDEENRTYRFNSPLLQAWWLKNIVI
jgi:uncharacterized protein